MRSRNWKQLLNDALAGLYPALQAMTDAELRLVIRAPKRMTDTNCWWVAYRAAPLLAEIAGDILRARQKERRRSAAAVKLCDTGAHNSNE